MAQPGVLGWDASEGTRRPAGALPRPLHTARGTRLSPAVRSSWGPAACVSTRRARRVQPECPKAEPGCQELHPCVGRRYPQAGHRSPSPHAEKSKARGAWATALWGRALAGWGGGARRVRRPHPRQTDPA